MQFSLGQTAILSAHQGRQQRRPRLPDGWSVLT